MGFITRNLKRKGVRIGIVLIIIGVCSGAFAYYNTKPNINNLTYDGIPVAAEKLEGIGEETLKAVVDNQPYSDMAELKQVANVGEKRYKILKNHFDTHDICRIEFFYLSTIFGIFCCVVGVMLAYYRIEYSRISTKEIFKAARGERG